MSSIAPTIGRKVWLFQSALHAGVLNPAQAFDASIVYVHEDGKVNLLAADHTGATRAFESIELRDPAVTDEHGVSDFATWMPYQVGQAKQAPTAPLAPTQFPHEPALSPSPERVLVEGAGIVSTEYLAKAGIPVAG